MKTADPEYEAWKRKMEQKGWKRALDVQAPYRMHTRFLAPGRMLEIGCGTGRVLRHLRDRSGVGIDTNPQFVRYCREQGLTAYEPDEFLESPDARLEFYDTLFFAHVAEHLGVDGSVEVLRQWLPYLRRGGRVILFTPMEIAFGYDPTHIEFIDFEKLRVILERLELTEIRTYSYPFPRRIGRFFPYNEFVGIGRRS